MKSERKGREEIEEREGGGEEANLEERRMEKNGKETWKATEKKDAEKGKEVEGERGGK